MNFNSTELKVAAHLCKAETPANFTNTKNEISLRFERIGETLYVDARVPEFNLRDLKNTTITTFSKYNGIKLHENYLKDARSIIYPIHKEILRKPTDKIIFSGHHLGGAITQVAALIISRTTKPRPSIQVISFGSPRVFSFISIPDILQDFKHFRFVYDCDPIPKFPFIFSGYSHKGDTILLTENKIIHKPLWEGLPNNYKYTMNLYFNKIMTLI